MPESYYNPDQASPLIGVSASTLRNWCKTYADELSEGANPPIGTERRLTQQDVAKLQQVKVWRDNRMSTQEIKRLLQAAASANEPAPLIVNAPQSPQTTQGARSDDLPLAIVLSSIEKRYDATDAHLATTDARLATLEKAIAAVEQRQGEKHSALVTGIVIGAAIVVVVFALVLTVGQ